jgi:hypothetical protein
MRRAAGERRLFRNEYAAGAAHEAVGRLEDVNYAGLKAFRRV